MTDAAVLSDHERLVNAVAVAPDGKSFAAATDGNVTCWNAATRKVLWTSKLPDTPFFALRRQVSLCRRQVARVNEGDPTSPPKSPPGPFGELKGLTTKLATMYTKMINDHGPAAERLHKCLTWCGLVDHPHEGATPKFAIPRPPSRLNVSAGRARTPNQEM